TLAYIRRISASHSAFRQQAASYEFCLMVPENPTFCVLIKATINKVRNIGGQHGALHTPAKGSKQPGPISLCGLTRISSPTRASMDAMDF
ncbi:hypothetical protein K5D34_23320, partial [Pseudomonas cichorii]|nr:hypothetical protein [Pseudomonas cichorii]